ncbi:helix-turn-helix transcriptional regulator [Sinomicrobium weinanense]|uniref:Helix-turn-helix transcriptional regulator n=1 Tax=Sinomicrobium weinanense TaxID=2842200 RepID=A0A926Q3M4_9FLAO|nr:helix-turn-helix transcriptional regulator [Sinomicrobium weinanense]MBC9795940.1 helix-turn-helix transcriptional regulator [Sinomicrobium weinanense]MBU3122059.1 helix-turn-helix transcriptional regulator [Sinomicrobium weinanense]
MIVTLHEGEYLGQTQKSTACDSVKFSETVHEINSYTETHRHENQYFSILLKGTYLEKNEASETRVLPGDALFRPGGYVHQNYFTDRDVHCFNMEFGKTWMKKYDYDFKFPEQLAHFKAGMTPFLVQMLVGFMDGKQIDLIEETIADFLFQVHEKPVKLRQPWLAKLLKMLENELDSFHSLDSLSKRVFVHPIYMARAFKQNTGVTIGQYQLKVKLVHALYLLMNTLKPISEISHLNGFYDDSHFINSFKSYYKISPHQFRLMVKS